MSSAYSNGSGRLVMPCPRCGKAIRRNEVRCSNCGLQFAPMPPSGPTSFPPGPVSGILGSGPAGWAPGGPPSSQPERPGAMPPRPQLGQRPPTQPLQQGQGPLSYPGASAPNGSMGGLFPPPPIQGPVSNGSGLFPPPPVPGPVNNGSGFFPPAGFGGNQGGFFPPVPGVSIGNVSGVSPLSSTPSRPFPGSIYAQQGPFPASPLTQGVQGPHTSDPWNQQPRDGRSMPQSSRQRSRRKSMVIIGIVLLALLLIGVGVAGLDMVNAENNAGGAMVPAPTGQPLFRDSFTDNKNGWDMQSNPGLYTVAEGNGSLVLEDDDHTLLWEMLPSSKPFGDFQLSVDATLSKGDAGNGYGLFIRGGTSKLSQLATYYRFSLYGDGSYAIFKGDMDASGLSKSNQLVDYMKSATIKKQGQVNHITILAQGSSMTFIVNGLILKTITDTSYTSGSIAFFVANLQNAQAGAQATFAQCSIYPYKK